MSFSFYINIILLILIFSALIFYLYIKLSFTRSYNNVLIPQINSANDVISNNDLKNIIDYYKVVYDLREYEIVIDDQENFKNIGTNLNKKRKKITISNRVFESVGYEIDYILANMWFASRQIQKDNTCRVYNAINNYGFIFNSILFILLFAINIILFIVTVYSGEEEIANKALRFLWKVPVLEIINLLLTFNFIIFFFISNNLKKHLEIEYSKTLVNTFRTNFKEYSFDLSAARQYSQDNYIAYNFAFKNNETSYDKIKWLGPFVHYSK